MTFYRYVDNEYMCGGNEENVDSYVKHIAQTKS
jgi:hypothetical protein